MPTTTQQDALRSLPQVEELLRHEAVQALINVLPRELVVDMVRDSIDAVRHSILDGGEPDSSADALAIDVLRRALLLEKPSLKRVINASGVIIHTNLGRSVLAEPAVAAVTQVARGYSTLEYDCSTMARGSRHDHYERMICTLTGAEAALAVNNNAAAVMMVLSEFAAGHEAIISRGELVEIGGSFRVPDIMALSNAKMVEVGTTNKTHLFDYENMLSEQTAMLLKVHPSNFRMTGFTESVSLKDLRRLADEVNGKREPSNKVLVYEDLGSGALTDIASDGMHEKTVREALVEGADLVSFSCDKLLGGPQAGIIVGKKKYISKMKKHPLARAMRVDKMTFAALEATLAKYKDPAIAIRDIPVLNMIAASSEDMKAKAGRLADMIREVNPHLSVEITAVEDQIGGGSAPMVRLPGWAAAVSDADRSADSIERRLRKADVPVIARIHDDRLLLCVRTIFENEFELVAEALR